MPKAVENNNPPSATRKRKEAASSTVNHNENGPSKKKRKRKLCSVDKCPNKVQNGGLCQRHGAKVKLCSVPECTNRAKRRGLCKRHGAYSENNQDGANHSNVATATTDNYSSIFPQFLFPAVGGQKGMPMNHNFGAANSGFCQPTTQSGSLQYSNAPSGNQQIEPAAEIGDNEATKMKEAASSLVNHDNNESGLPKKKYKYVCKVAGCSKWRVIGGMCAGHGAKDNRNLCSVPECYIAKSRKNGLCGYHFKLSTQDPNQRCQFQYPTHRCATIATYDGFCWKHHHHRNNRGDENNQVGMNQQIEPAAEISDNNEELNSKVQSTIGGNEGKEPLPIAKNKASAPASSKEDDAERNGSKDKAQLKGLDGKDEEDDPATLNRNVGLLDEVDEIDGSNTEGGKELNNDIGRGGYDQNDCFRVDQDREYMIELDKQSDVALKELAVETKNNEKEEIRIIQRLNAGLEEKEKQVVTLEAKQKSRSVDGEMEDGNDEEVEQEDIETVSNKDPSSDANDVDKDVDVEAQGKETPAAIATAASRGVEEGEETLLPESKNKPTQKLTEEQNVHSYVQANDIPEGCKQRLRDMCTKPYGNKPASDKSLAVILSDELFIVIISGFLVDSRRKNFKGLPGPPPSLLEGGYYIILPKSVAKEYACYDKREYKSGAWMTNSNYASRHVRTKEEYIQDWGGSRLHRFPMLMKERRTGKESIRAILYIIGLAMIVEVIPQGESSEGEGVLAKSQMPSASISKCSRLGCSLINVFGKKSDVETKTMMVPILQTQQCHDEYKVQKKNIQKALKQHLQLIYKLQMLGFALVFEKVDEEAVRKEMQYLYDEYVDTLVTPFSANVFAAVKGLFEEQQGQNGVEEEEKEEGKQDSAERNEVRLLKQRCETQSAALKAKTSDLKKRAELALKDLELKSKDYFPVDGEVDDKSDHEKQSDVVPEEIAVDTDNNETEEIQRLNVASHRGVGPLKEFDEIDGGERDKLNEDIEWGGDDQDDFSVDGDVDDKSDYEKQSDVVPDEIVVDTEDGEKEEIQRLNAELNETKRLVADLNGSLEEAARYKSSSESERVERQSELASLRAQLRTKELELNEKSENIAALKQKFNTELVETKLQSESYARDATEKLDRKDEEINQLKSEVTEKDEETNKLKSDVENMKSQCQMMESRQKEVEEKNATIIDQIELKGEVISNLQAKNVETDEVIAKLKSEVSEKDAELNKLRSKRTRRPESSSLVTTCELNDAKEKIAELKKKIAELEAKLKRQKANKKGEEDDADAEKQKLRDALSGTVVREKPNVTWDDVAGLSVAKRSLKNNVIMPTKFPQLFTGERRPFKGILLYGPPGTGKSYLAKAVATEANSTFFSVSPSDLVSKWYGESERLVRNLFDMARESSGGKAIIFIDEVDSLCRSRSEDEADHTRRFKTEILVQMDGVGKNEGDVLVLGATNVPWELDAAIRRRFEKRIYIPLPDAEARSHMVKLHLGDTPNSLSENDFDELGRLTEGASGSDIKVLVKEAIMKPVERCQEAQQFIPVDNFLMPCEQYPNCPRCPTKLSSDPQNRDRACKACNAIRMQVWDVQPEKLKAPDVCMKDFRTMLRYSVSSVSEDELGKYTEWTKQFGQEGTEPSRVERTATKGENNSELCSRG